MKPKLIVIAGPNGSGKTSVTGKILEHKWVEDCTYVNPDQIAQDTFGDWNSTDAILKALIFSAEKREECLNQKKSLCFETVFSAPDKVDFLKRAKNAGFFIRLFFVCTDSPVINAGRIANRVMEGGHDVPTSKVISRYSKSIANCCAIAKIVDRLYVYDNSINYNDVRLLFRAADGKIEKTYTHISNWAQGILRVFD